eukprot:TRINITY_DN64856_c1_g1_i3.p1 TRINITY_DN64856_c1_g1~~TRINITY_DN64856_c1_g1_i3.p1  ORF type:complete len:290 (+),score=141.40 TRINITY_DN64856_c1_g1_i3:78-947(+)
MKEGKIVPVDITVGLIKAAIERHQKQGKHRFLVDGFPRNEDNLRGWKRVMGTSVDVPFLLFFDCPEDVMEKRLLQRGQTSGRVDDNIETIRKRFVSFQRDTMPIILRFASRQQMHQIKATRSVDRVFADVKAVFDQHLREQSLEEHKRRQAELIAKGEAFDKGSIVGLLPGAKVRANNDEQKKATEATHDDDDDGDDDGVDEPAMPVPERFKKIQYNDTATKKQHPLYRTSASQLGARPPAEEELPHEYRPLNSKFSSNVARFGMYRHNGLNAAAGSADPPPATSKTSS